MALWGFSIVLYSDATSVCNKYFYNFGGEILSFLPLVSNGDAKTLVFSGFRNHL